jgi:hypothetical protein
MPKFVASRNIILLRHIRNLLLKFFSQTCLAFFSKHCSKNSQRKRHWYRVFSSPELKAQVSFSDRPASVCLSVLPSVCVCLSVCKLLHFRLLLQNHWTNLNQTWHKLSLGEEDSSLFKGRG